VLLTFFPQTELKSIQVLDVSTVGQITFLPDATVGEKFVSFAKSLYLVD
jgi:hypothetical protein